MVCIKLSGVQGSSSKSNLLFQQVNSANYNGNWCILVLVMLHVLHR